MAATIGYANTVTSIQFACESFDWNGQSITSSGSYDQIFTNASGCDSVHTLAATIGYANTVSSIPFSYARFSLPTQSLTSSASYDQIFTNAPPSDSEHT